MFHNRRLKHEINRFWSCERAWRIFFKTEYHHLRTSLQVIDQWDYQKNLQVLPAEMYKIVIDSFSDTVKCIFRTKRSQYSIRNASTFSTRNVRTISYWLQSLCYTGFKNWEYTLWIRRVSANRLYWKKKSIHSSRK